MQSTTRLDLIFSALSDPTRRAILGRLADGDATVAELAAPFGLQQPTISSLADDLWVDVNTILNESIVRNIIPRLKSAGARGIVEYPLNKVIE